LNFPLPATCKEKGINATVADQLVWQKIAEMMSSPELLSQQVERWFKSRNTKAKAELVDVEALKKEVSKISDQVERYNKGYGAGVFSLEQLKHYTVPLQEKVNQIKIQISSVASEVSQIQLKLPNKQDMELFALKAKETLQKLNFEAKRAIILNTVETIVGNRNNLQVIGFIPINQYVAFKSNHRHRRATKCGEKHPFQGADEKSRGN